MTSRPNPGSQEARQRGCRCPVGDNNNGKWPPRPPDGWFISEVCIVHRAEYDAIVQAQKQRYSR